MDSPNTSPPQDVVVVSPDAPYKCPYGGIPNHLCPCKRCKARRSAKPDTPDPDVVPTSAGAATDLPHRLEALAAFLTMEKMPNAAALVTEAAAALRADNSSSGQYSLARVPVHNPAFVFGTPFCSCPACEAITALRRDYPELLTEQTLRPKGGA